MKTASIRILFEEPSARAAGEILVPKILASASIEVQYIQHQCKSELLERIPGLFAGYARILGPKERVIVLVDEDREDCRELKARIEQFAIRAGLHHAKPDARWRRLFVRIVVEELEAWYFGDWNAVKQAFPKVPGSIPQKSPYRNPDQIRGGTKEAFERILQKAGYYPSGVPRIEVARRVAGKMDPDRNTSPSFQLFRDPLRSMVR